MKGFVKKMNANTTEAEALAEIADAMENTAITELSEWTVKNSAAPFDEAEEEKFLERLEEQKEGFAAIIKSFVEDSK